MKAENPEKYYKDIRLETENSSTLRLLCEITRWDEVAHEKELEIIAQEILNRMSLNKISLLLFSICFIMSNIGNTFSEHFYVFDEDEREIRRQLKNDILTHLTILLLISFSFFFAAKVITMLILCLYIIWTTKMTIEWYRPLFTKIKKSATNTVFKEN